MMVRMGGMGREGGGRGTDDGEDGEGGKGGGAQMMGSQLGTDAGKGAQMIV